jgi:hypothetical protein
MRQPKNLTPQITERKVRRERETLPVKKQAIRTQYLVDNDGLSKVLALLASRDYKECIIFCKKIFYAKKGTERRDLDFAEIQKFISKGFK